MIYSTVSYKLTKLIYIMNLLIFTQHLHLKYGVSLSYLYNGVIFSKYADCISRRGIISSSLQTVSVDDATVL